MRDLVAGERAGVSGDTVVLGLERPVRGGLALALVSLDAGRQVPAGMSPIDTVARELRADMGFDEDGRVEVTMAGVPDAVARLALVAFFREGPGARAGGGVTFRNTGPVVAVVGEYRFAPDLTDRADAALILVELYRHAGGWRLAANGQGFVGGLAAVAAAFGIEEDWARRLEGRAPEPGPSRGGSGSASAVAVAPHYLLSNAHVVDGAATIGAVSDGRSVSAELVFADPRNDLALLRVEREMTAVAPFRAGLDLHLGEDIVALGFPLQGLLGSGPQASAGNIAALCGIGNDSSLFQFTAPIASGNSGGPIVDPAGHLVGLVCSSLNLDHVRQSGGNAENVNFGIKAAMIRSFLDAFGVTPLIAEDAVPVGRAMMVRTARETIYRVTCAC